MILVDQLKLAYLADSNFFLRTLWASLRDRFGRLGGQSTPRRTGSQQLIRFGWLSLGTTAPTGLEVSIHYRQVGVIRAVQSIHFCSLYGKNFLLFSAQKYRCRYDHRSSAKIVEDRPFIAKARFADIENIGQNLILPVSWNRLPN